jgi:hypothetical protein
MHPPVFFHLVFNQKFHILAYYNNGVFMCDACDEQFDFELNDESQRLLDGGYEELVSVLKDCWSDECPNEPDDITEEWTEQFEQVYADAIKSYYELVFNVEQQHSLLLLLAGFYEIDWLGVANVVMGRELPTMVETFEIEYEREKQENMTDDERDEIAREIEGDRQYDEYVDNLINGD